MISILRIQVNFISRLTYLVVYLCGMVVVVGCMVAWKADNLYDDDSMMVIGMTADQRRYNNRITHWLTYVIKTGAWRHNYRVFR